MKNEPLISLIIPVYGVEKFLQKCLDSILAQTYKNMDIVVVDDGSIDSSGEICDEYAQKDKRIRVFHKKNGGLSDARNFGIEKSRGKYITFIDSDDYIEPDYICFLYKLISSDNYKMSICSIFNDFTKNGNIVDNGDGTFREISNVDALEMMCYHHLIDTCAYAKLFERSLFDNVKFPKGKVFEDIGTIYLLIDQCKKINCGFISKYHYVIRDDSITTKKFNEAKCDLIEMTDKMASYVVRKYPKLKNAVKRRRIYARFSTINQMLTIKDDTYLNLRDEYISFIKDNMLSVVLDKNTPMRDKVGCLLLLIDFRLYKKIWNYYLKYKKGM